MTTTAATYKQTATFTGNRGREVKVTADGRVGKGEGAGVDRQADGFLGSITDERIGEYLRTKDVSSLGGTWQALPESGEGLSADNGDQRVWKFGGSQQLNADLKERSVLLDTLGNHGRHTIRANFTADGSIVPKSITESFEPYNTAYVAMMREMY